MLIDTFSQVRHSLDGVMEYLLNNTPLNWLVGPFAPQLTEKGEDRQAVDKGPQTQACFEDQQVGVDYFKKACTSSAFSDRGLRLTCCWHGVFIFLYSAVNNALTAHTCEYKLC